MEFLDDTGDDTEREVNEENRAEEFDEFAARRFPGGVVRAHIARFEQCDEERQSQCERDEEKVVDRCDGELPSR